MIKPLACGPTHADLLYQSQTTLKHITSQVSICKGPDPELLLRPLTFLKNLRAGFIALEVARQLAMFT